MHMGFHGISSKMSAVTRLCSSRQSVGKQGVFLFMCTASVIVLIYLKPSVDAENAISPTYSDACELKEIDYGLLASCVAKGLTEVPSGFPSRLASLTLNVNRISKLTNQSFIGLPLLKNLSLGRNSISYIENGTFMPLLSLQVLIMNDNELTNLPNDLFQNNVNLYTIQLSANYFTTIPTSVFKTNSYMHNILLNNN